MAKQSLKRLCLAAIVGAAAWALSAPAFAAPLEAGGCSLNESAGLEGYNPFLSCVRNSSLSKDCKDSYQISAGIHCAIKTGARDCGSLLFVGGRRSPDRTAAWVQMVKDLGPCSVSNEVWFDTIIEGDSDEKAAELLRPLAQCMQPAVERFQSQAGC